MDDKAKRRLAYAMCIAVGVINFIVFAFDYLTEYVPDLYYTVTFSRSGYQMMNMWSFGFGGVLASFCQVLVLLLGIGMIIFGALALLKEYGKISSFPEKLFNVESEKLAVYALILMFILNLGVIVFSFIITWSTWLLVSGIWVEFGLSYGMFVALGVSIGAISVVVPKKKEQTSANTVEENKPQEEETVTLDDVIPKATESSDGNKDEQ